MAIPEAVTAPYSKGVVYACIIKGAGTSYTVRNPSIHFDKTIPDPKRERTTLYKFVDDTNEELYPDMIFNRVGLHTKKPDFRVVKRTDIPEAILLTANDHIQQQQHAHAKSAPSSVANPMRKNTRKRNSRRTNKNHSRRKRRNN